ncbi:MAG: SDR family NAD(P)-dependent oxidoreductase, partial [Steroidobacteraceae bacterium]
MPLSTPPPLGTAMLPAGTFSGKTVVVTGGGTGIGKGIALEFARLGANVAIMSRSQEHIDKGVAAVRALGAMSIGVSADIRVPEQISAAFDTIERECGPITALINNAAGNFPVPAEKLSPNGW